MIARNLMQEHYFDPQKRCALVSAIPLDQMALSVIGDFMISVVANFISLCCTAEGNEYSFVTMIKAKASLVLEFCVKA